MSRLAIPVMFALGAVLHAQTAFFPLKDIRPGMHGIGKTVFSGNRIDEFQVEVLGVLENIGPKQNLILARLSGGPLAETGVLQGMSGSPVYIDGKLAGAVALAWPFAKEAITGIRPIEEMVRVTEAGRTPPPTQVARNTSRNTPHSDVSLASMFAAKDLTRLLPGRLEPSTRDARDAKLLDIATPVSFGGFTRSTLDSFAPQLRALGLEPTQSLSAGGTSSPHMGDPSAIQPGSMISVQLMTGDLSIGADGTVTYIDGNRIYAFGHRFLAVGSTALPFTRAEVLALLPVMSASFKIDASKETMGAILQDRNTAISGELGRAAAMAPISISVSRGGKRLDNYRMEMVNDCFLSPLLVQMAVFNTIDATERTVGASSFRVTGEIELQGSAAPLKVNNMYAADTGSAMIASLSTAIPLAYVLQSGFEALEVKKVDLDIESFDAKKEFEIDSVSLGRREVRPGGKVELTTTLVGENGAELARSIVYQVPEGMTPGPLYFTVADGMTTNITEFRQIIGAQPKSISQLISIVNNLRANTKAYVRVWRPEPAFQLEGADLPDPPPSVAMILAGSQTAFGSIGQTRNSKIAELEIGAGEVEGDQVSSSSAPVMFRLNGENRLVLGGNSRALIRAIRADGHYFYLSSGSLEFDARKEPLAICARDHLYVPSIPGSGEIVIRDNKVDVRLTSGQMVRSGSDTCNSKAAPLFPANGIEAAAPAGTPAGGAGTATATAAAAGGTALPVTAAISIATASALGIATGEIASQSPASSSPTLPNP